MNKRRCNSLVSRSESLRFEACRSQFHLFPARELPILLGKFSHKPEPRLLGLTMQSGSPVYPIRIGLHD